MCSGGRIPEALATSGADVDAASLSRGRPPLTGVGASALLAACALASACQTLIPQQTASTVERGTWRLGGQISASPWCSTKLEIPGPGSCEQFPRGLLPSLPELRLSGRTGLVSHVDAGLSLHGAGVLQRGIRVGALADAKAELWSAPTPWGRQIVSAGVGLGLAREESSLGGSGRMITPQLEAVVPAFYGYQTGHWELVASGRFLERFTFLDVTGDGRAEVLKEAWLGFVLGAYTRAQTRVGLSLEYAAPTRALQTGSFTASVGVLFDLGGQPARDRRSDQDAAPESGAR